MSALLWDKLGKWAFLTLVELKLVGHIPITSEGRVVRRKAWDEHAWEWGQHRDKTGHRVKDEDIIWATICIVTEG